MRLRPDKAPSISYMEGALLYLARRGCVVNADTPGSAKMSAWVNRLACYSRVSESATAASATINAVTSLRRPGR
jgi:hypothetical protein